MDFLNIEYTKYDSENKAWKNSLFSAIVLLLVFLLFQPFGFRDKDLALKAVLFPGYALFAFMYSYFNFRIVRHILKKKKKWTLKNELIYFLISMLVLSFAVHLFSCWVSSDLPISFKWYFKLLYHVSCLFLLISIIEFFYHNNRAAGINTRKLTTQYKKVKYKLEVTKKQDQELILISLEKEQMEINRNKIVYIQSMGNYLEFYLRESNREIIKITKRGRLHLVEKDLAPFSEFFKCHRAFIINLKQAIQLKGNIKNARVVFEGNPREIPVSRSLFKTLKEQLEKIRLT